MLWEWNNISGLQEPARYSNACEYSSCSVNWELVQKETKHNQVCKKLCLYSGYILKHTVARCSLKWFVDDYYIDQDKERFTKSQYENMEIVNGDMRGKAGSSLA